MEEEKKSKLHKVYKVIMLIILTAFITFMITSLTMYTHYSKGDNNIGAVIKEALGSSSGLDSTLKKIKNQIDKNYLWKDKIDEKELEEWAIKGYVEGLGDKYTEYIPKDEMEKYTEELTGSFVGIGIYMIADEKTDSIVVYYPIPESPAEKAGIKSGDIIKSVDGVKYGYEDFNKIADNIKGAEGTKVTLVIERDKKEKTFEITRAKVNTNPITIKLLKDNIGYVNFPSFDTDSAKNFKEKIQELEKQGAKSLIIDLRNNGGGILDECTEIADYFLEKGKTIMSTKDNKGKEEIEKTKDDAIFTMPVVILVNENTASSSEILSGALKENDRAKVVGTKTYGKGVIQTLMTLSNGSGLKITTAEYHTPKGTAINGFGIEPDEVVELPKDVESVFSVSEKQDTQLQKAIQILSKK